MKATMQLRDGNGMTAAMRGRIESKRIRAAEKEAKALAKESGKLAGQELVRDIEKMRSEPLRYPPRTVEEMQEFAYGVINRELSWLDRLSANRGLDEDEVQSLVRLLAALNTTAKTGKALKNDESDEPQPMIGETEEAYKARLKAYYEGIANG